MKSIVGIVMAVSALLAPGAQARDYTPQRSAGAVTFGRIEVSLRIVG